MNANQSVQKKIPFMTPSKMAKCFGVSLPTFLIWMKHVTFEIDDLDEGTLKFFSRKEIKDKDFFHLTFQFKCARRIISPAEVQMVCNALGDPECTLNFKRTTLSMLAKEAGISMKTAMRIKKEVIDEYEVYNWNRAFPTKCLIPKNVNLFRKKFGLN